MDDKDGLQLVELGERVWMDVNRHGQQRWNGVGGAGRGTKQQHMETRLWLNFDLHADDARLAMWSHIQVRTPHFFKGLEPLTKLVAWIWIPLHPFFLVFTQCWYRSLPTPFFFFKPHRPLTKTCTLIPSPSSNYAAKWKTGTRLSTCALHINQEPIV
jgi:hypothetical protein